MPGPLFACAFGVCEQVHVVTDQPDSACGEDALHEFGTGLGVLFGAVYFSDIME